MEFPPNSKTAQEGAPNREPKVERVTSAAATRRKKSLGQQFKSTFFAGDPKSASQHVIFEVIIPAIQEAMVESVRSGIEKLILGSSSRGRGPKPSAGATGYVSYNRVPMGQSATPPTSQMSRRARAQHDFDELVLESRTEAEDVIDRMFDILSRYDSVNVAELYEMVGLNSTHADVKWGWTDLRGSGVSRLRSGGYLLNLPTPHPLPS